MNRKGGGPFGLVIALVVCLVLVYVWLVISPTAIEPSIDTTIAAVAGSDNADGTEFFLRAIPWAVPLILILGFIYWGVSGK